MSTLLSELDFLPKLSLQKLSHFRVHRVLEKSLKVLEFWKKFQALENP